MNISYNWLKDLIEFGESVEDLAAGLTRVGLAVEGIHRTGDDAILDIDLTSNRPDCLSHLGVAREIAAITGNELKTEKITKDEQADLPPVPAVLAYDVVKVENPDLCYRFTARIIKDVKVGPSPEWLVKRLEAVGERSINNVADITNYVMLELGQPMHAFDLDKLSDRRIVVRRAKNGESITTLDEVERKLDSCVLAICDADRPVAIGGVMGGLDSAITPGTVNVLLEVAYFDRANIRRTSRKLNLVTEASYRFERGVDINNLSRASERAAQMIKELAGGEMAGFYDIYPTRANGVIVESRDLGEAVQRLTGLDIDSLKASSILGSLGIKPSDSAQGTTRFRVPSWRHDIGIEEDLVEEVTRHAGYESIGTELPPSFGSGEYQPAESRRRQIRRALANLGFSEALSYSFIDANYDGMMAGSTVGADGSFVTLRDSVIEGAVRMRPTLLPGLLEAVLHNFNHQRRDLYLFEIGRVFNGADPDGLPRESEVLALAVTGNETFEDRAAAGRPLDFYDAKGALQAALAAADLADIECAAADLAHLRKGQSARIVMAGRTIGAIGRISDEISARFKFKQPVYVAEIDLGTALNVPPAKITYRPLARYPSVVRDVSFLVKRELSFRDLKSAIEEQKFELCRSVSFVDEFQGKGVAADERSVTVRLEYRSDERTMTEGDVDAVHEEILRNVEANLGIRPRF